MPFTVCPYNCDDCEFDETLELLVCISCASGYRSNDGVCGACPSNCLTCTDQSGTMECSTCDAGYAMRSTDKVCVKCPSNCLECDAKSSSVLCKKCNIGYAVAADKLKCSSELIFNDLCGNMLHFILIIFEHEL